MQKSPFWKRIIKYSSKTLFFTKKKLNGTDIENRQLAQTAPVLLLELKEKALRVMFLILSLSIIISWKYKNYLNLFWKIYGFVNVVI